MAKNITIRDVAAQAGVTVSTVSRILSGAETPIAISEETRQRVLQAAHDLSYRPHIGARMLRSKTSNLLGLIVREIEDPFFAQLIKNIRSAAKKRGLELVIGYAEAEPSEALRISELMMDLRYCDGMLLVGDLHETPDDLSFLNKIGWSIPLVLVCRGNSQLVGNYLSISTDNRAGTSLALDYLTSLGHQRIAFLGGGRLGDLQERQQAYREYMQQHFGDSESQFIQPAENSLEGGYQGMCSILQQAQLSTAVFASDDTMAIGASRAAYEHNVRVPQDMSIMGFDDILSAAYTTPSLTTVRQPLELLSFKAVEMLDCLVKKNELCGEAGDHVSLLPELIVRNSCAAPRS